MSKDAKNVPALRFKGYSDAWEKRKVSDYLCESRIPGSNGLKAKKLTVKLWGKGVVPKNETYSGSIKTKYYVRSANQLIYGKLDFLHAAFGIVPQSLDGWESTIDSPAFDVNTSIGNAAFLLALFLRPNFYLREGIRANGSRKAKRIHEDTFLSMSISAPQRKEQDQIAVVLDKTELLIAATQDKIDALEQAKKALLQRLFDQSWRFKGYSDPWEKRKLGEVVERVTRKNRDLVSTRPLTISAQDGLVDQRKFFSKTVASKNISNYFLLKAGDFAYNKSYSVGYPWGAVKRLDKYPSGVLSTLYIVFKPKKINSQFLVTYFEGTTWYVSVSKVASEGARNHGLLNISASDFFDQQLFFPTKKTEQESIGLTIKVLDDLIAATQSRLSSLELLKKALLQDLFI